MFKNIIRLYFLFFPLMLAGLFSSGIIQAEDTAVQTMRSVQKRYASLQSLEFDFTQITLTNGRPKEGKGHAVFCRPSENKGDAKAAASGVMIGTGISLFLWAMILAVVFAVR